MTHLWIVLWHVLGYIWELFKGPLRIVLGCFVTDFMACLWPVLWLVLETV